MSLISRVFETRVYTIPPPGLLAARLQPSPKQRLDFSIFSVAPLQIASRFELR